MEDIFAALRGTKMNIAYSLLNCCQGLYILAYKFEKWYKPERIVRALRVGEKSHCIGNNNRTRYVYYHSIDTLDVGIGTSLHPRNQGRRVTNSSLA